MQESPLLEREVIPQPSLASGEGFLDSQAQQLLRRARKRCGTIEPCAGKSWEECFLTYKGVRMLYFNTLDGNTHVELERPL